jgi:hypothetical protein
MREFCESRLEYVFDRDIKSLDEITIRKKSNILLVERISNTDFVRDTDIKVVKFWNKAGNSERVFKVAKCNDSVFFDPRYQDGSVYDTDMEVKEGDVIIINSLESLNTYIFTFEGKTYHAIKYDNIVCKIVEGKPVPVNGYVLISPVTKVNKFKDFESKYSAPNQGLVEAIGTPNRDYKRNYHPSTGKPIKGRKLSDKGYDEMEVGDQVILKSNIAFIGSEQGASIWPLESEEHMTFDKMYYVTQRPNIIAILKKWFVDNENS